LKSRRPGHDISGRSGFILFREAKYCGGARYGRGVHCAGIWRRRWETAAFCSLLPDVEDLPAPTADLEPDGKGIPILVRQYMKLGGKLLAFSVDPQFNNALDHFVMIDLTMIDLTTTSPEMLARYMGKERAPEFLAWHRALPPRVA
jgi:hypothetical protein